MKRAVFVFLTAVAAGVGLIAAAGFVAKSLIEGAGKDRLVAAVEEAAGVPVSMGSAGFDMGQWFRLRPSLPVEDVAIGNPPGFRGKQLLHAKRCTRSALSSRGSRSRRTRKAQPI